MSYKIAFRAHVREGGDHPITWEPGCPLLFETIQVARSVETGKAFLQAKLTNLTAGEVASYHARFIVAYRDGSTQSFDVEPLDADIAPGSSHQITPLALKGGDALYAEGVVLSVRTAEGDWKSSGAPSPLPVSVPLELSAKALGERRAQLLPSCSMPPDDAENALREEDGYWICPCGRPNMGTELCGACGAPLEKLRVLEDEPELERMAIERAAREKKQEEEKAAQNAKMKKIAIIVGAVVIVAVAVAVVFFGVVKPMITETCYRATTITSYDDDVPGRVSAEVTYTLDGKGNVVAWSQNSESLYGGGTSSYSATCEVDKTGLPASLESDDLTPYIIEVNEEDEFGQPTKFTKTFDDGDKTNYTVEYYGEGHIKRIESSSDFASAVYEYDENGFRVYYRSDYDSAYVSDSETTSSYQYDENGRVTTREDVDEDGHAETYSYVYDDNGNISKICYGDDPDTKFVDAEYSYALVENPSPWTRVVSNLKPSVSPV